MIYDFLEKVLFYVFYVFFKEKYKSVQFMLYIN